MDKTTELHVFQRTYILHYTKAMHFSHTTIAKILRARKMWGNATQDKLKKITMPHHTFSI